MYILKALTVETEINFSSILEIKSLVPRNCDLERHLHLQDYVNKNPSCTYLFKCQRSISYNCLCLKKYILELLKLLNAILRTWYGIMIFYKAEDYFTKVNYEAIRMQLFQEYTKCSYL